MSQFTSDWDYNMKRAYAKGVEKGKRLAADEAMPEMDVFARDRAMAARAAMMGLLSSGKGYMEAEALARAAWDIADAFIAEGQRR